MHLPRWQREQKKRRRKAFFILIRLIPLLILTGLIFFSGIWFWKISKSSQLPKSGGTTIVLATEPTIVVSLNSQEEMIIISIPETTHVEATHGFGSYRLGAVWALGKQEKLGGQLLAETIQELLAVPVDGWIGNNIKPRTWNIEHRKEGVFNLKDTLVSWKIFLKPALIRDFYENLDTNLTVFDLAKLWWKVKTVRFDKIRFVDLEKTPALTSLILADGTKVLTADMNYLDTTIKDLFKENQIVDEHLLIEVLNGAEKAGLGNRVARLITNLGGTVVSLGNNSQTIKGCRISGNDKTISSFTSQKLVQIFNCETVLLKEAARVDLVVIIGEDYWRKLFQR